ncbi:uncharacterized protein METZ01_LOCUS437336 [marine metagenome]|uniref:Uncharacterized protein n=1 Tax=marine metagenome TaxID=408172 RepID=A0A382YMI9_9ZZZZ
MEYVIFDDKTLSDVFKDIYKNTESKREQINTFVTKLVRQIRTPEDAAVISPIIKDFMEVNVKNDEHIVRIAQIAQRAIAIGTKAASSTELLTEEEKQQLLSNIKLEIDDLQQETTEVEDELTRLKVG